MYPDLTLWKNPPYEYEYEKLPIDILSGNEFLRTWVGDRSANKGDLDDYLAKDELSWQEEAKGYYLY